MDSSVESQKPQPLLLELFDASGILNACRFTNFTATNARRIAKYLSGRRSGKEQNAHIAARPGFPKSCRSLLPRPATLLMPQVARASPVRVACAAPEGHIPTSCFLQSKLAYQVFDALLECFATRNQDPINSSRRDGCVDEIVRSGSYRALLRSFPIFAATHG
jgi:hypothetical protein